MDNDTGRMQSGERDMPLPALEEEWRDSQGKLKELFGQLSREDDVPLYAQYDHLLQISTSIQRCLDVQFLIDFEHPGSPYANPAQFRFASDLTQMCYELGHSAAERALRDERDGNIDRDR